METEYAYLNFLNSRGQQCPFCHSENIWHEDAEQTDALNIDVWFMCNHCLSDWYVEYHLMMLHFVHISSKAKRIMNGEEV